MTPEEPEELSPLVVRVLASNPGIMQLNVPYPAKLLQLPKPPIRDIPDYDQKLKAMAEAYLDHDVRSLSVDRLIRPREPSPPRRWRPWSSGCAI